MEGRNKIIEKLNDVLERNFDAISRYQDASRNVSNELLKTYFIKQAKQKLAFGKEIKAGIIALGGKPVSEGSLLGIFHRSWVNFKTSLNHDNESEVCQACIGGEQEAVKEYDGLLAKEAVQGKLRVELEQHKAKTVEAIAELEGIKKSFK